MRRRLGLLLLTTAAAVLTACSAAGAASIPRAPVASNPAERLLRLPIEPSLYESASRCLPRARRPGTESFAAWLAANAAGVFWGAYRCEMWGPGSASLHAEKRAVDWHLDAGDRREKRQAERLIRLLTAPDSAGNRHALARRMGIEEIIWDCGYWAAGMASFRLYSPCTTRSGRLRRRVNTTIAHRDHIHFGLTRDGALGRTSFWQRAGAAAGAAVPARRRTPREGAAPAPSADVAPARGGGTQAPATLG